jgi:hypothetical protein
MASAFLFNSLFYSLAINPALTPLVLDTRLPVILIKEAKGGLYDKGIFVLSVFLAIINFCSFISPFGI